MHTWRSARSTRKSHTSIARCFPTRLEIRNQRLEQIILGVIEVTKVGPQGIGPTTSIPDSLNSVAIAVASIFTWDCGFQPQSRAGKTRFPETVKQAIPAPLPVSFHPQA